VSCNVRPHTQALAGVTRDHGWLQLGDALLLDHDLNLGIGNSNCKGVAKQVSFVRRLNKTPAWHPPGPLAGPGAAEAELRRVFPALHGGRQQ
jgi:hypothetical protein